MLTSLPLGISTINGFAFYCCKNGGKFTIEGAVLNLLMPGVTKVPKALVCHSKGVRPRSAQTCTSLPSPPHEWGDGQVVLA